MLLLDVVLVVVVDVVVMALEVVVCADVDVEVDETPVGDVLVTADVLDVVEPGLLPVVWLVLLPALVTPEDAVPEALPLLPPPLFEPPDIAPVPACVPPLPPDAPAVLPPVAPPDVPGAFVVPVAERCDALAPPSADSKLMSGKAQAFAMAAHATTTAPLANRDAGLLGDLERRMGQNLPAKATPPGVTVTSLLGSPR
jgi:hypothetical protein